MGELNTHQRLELIYQHKQADRVPGKVYSEQKVAIFKQLEAELIDHS